ncbi:MAG: acetate--CoA ligase family protein [Candidatus Woesearchaeota archaeon]
MVVLRQLSMRESYALLRKYGVPCIYPHFLEKDDDIHKIHTFPVALKVVSDDIVHKSDVGGIVLDVTTPRQVKETAVKMLKEVQKKAPNAKLNGIAVFRQIEGTQLLVGMKRDSSFGCVYAFGMGGVLVEVLKDVALHVGKMTVKDADLLIKKTKADKLIRGTRGQHALDRKAIIDILVRTARLCEAHPEIKELDFNPVIANDKIAKVVDVRVMVDG